MIKTGRSGRTRTRRLIAGLVLAAAPLLAAVVGPAAAQAVGATPSAPPATPGKAVCTINDDRIAGVVGLLATTSGFLAVDNGANGPSSVTVFHLNTKCSVTDLDRRDRESRDPADLVAGTKSSLLIADFGDPDGSRASIALWKLAANSGTATIYRMSYPDGAQDAQAMLVGPADTPIVITTHGGIYTPTGPLKAEQSAPGVALKKAGQLTLKATDTPNPLGVVGTTTITGAAQSPDGTKVVIRTFSDAYEWDVAKGTDLVAAITTGTPRRTALPNESDGEAIAYSPDGKSYYTVSTIHQNSGATSSTILRYTPYVPPPPGSASAAAPDSSSPWWASLTLQQLNLIFAGSATFGLAVLVAGIVGLRRAKPRTDDRPPAPRQRQPVGRQNRRPADDYGPGDGVHDDGYRSHDGVYRSESVSRRGPNGPLRQRTNEPEYADDAGGWRDDAGGNGWRDDSPGRAVGRAVPPRELRPRDRQPPPY